MELDFGSGAFDGDARWIQIEIDCGAGPVTLSPRQRLTPAPYALYAPAAGAVPWSGLIGVPGDLADGDDDSTYAAGMGLELSGDVFSLAAGYRLPQGCGNGQIAEWGGTAWVCAEDDTGIGAYWALTGNSGTNPAIHFLGTSDNQALELRVNGARALRLEPNASSPNLAGGYSDNSVAAGVAGATISGGGRSGAPNQVTADYGTVAGGGGNIAGGNDATVAGGWSNSAIGMSAVTGGGRSNEADGILSVIGGGESNLVSGSYGTIGGGYDIAVGGAYATVSGGSVNAADGSYATIGGGESNRVTDDYSTVGGGSPIGPVTMPERRRTAATPPWVAAFTTSPAALSPRSVEVLSTSRRPNTPLWPGAITISPKPIEPRLAGAGATRSPETTVPSAEATTSR